MVYRNIKDNYDNDTNKCIRQHRNLNRQITDLKSSSKFLMRCRKARIIPNFLQDKTKHIDTIFAVNGSIPPKIKKTLQRNLYYFHIKTLNLLIKHKHQQIKENEKLITRAKERVQSNLTQEDNDAWSKSEQTIIEHRAQQKENNHKKKYLNLREKIREEHNRTFNMNNDWFVNKTEISFPHNIKWLLSLGPKFALPLTKKGVPLLKYITDGEDCIQTLTDNEEKENARIQFTTAIHHHIKHIHHNVTDKFLLGTVEQTKKFLKNNPNIIILNADKGNKTVAMKRDDYDQRMEEMLNDMVTYRRLNKDPTTILEKKNNDLVENLFKKNIITQQEKKRLVTKTAIAPRIYGLPKIHKEGLPLRPICSSMNAPAYGLCKYLATILQNLTKDSIYNTKNSIEFKERYNNGHILEEESLVSFDVVSLFPSIPVEFAVEIIQKRWNKITAITDIPKDLFFQLLKFCIKENRYFKFKDKTYVQLKGMPMGSPLSPIIADIIMEELLTSCIEKLEHKPRLLTKYVDDIICITNKNAITSTLDELNKFHKNIKFTMELEEHGRLPYLDAVAIRERGTIKINWYQKRTASGRLINFLSKHPKNIIFNTAKNFVDRVLNTSDRKYHKENIEKIQHILKKNNFPVQTVNGLIKKFYTKENTQSEPNIAPKIFKSMTYIPGLSEKFKNTSMYNKEKVNIAASINNTTKNLYNNMKTKIDIGEKSNIVYQIPCSGGKTEKCNMVYIGTTKNKFKSRLANHKSDQRSRHKTEDQKTALASHCAKTSHTPEYESAKVLTQERHYTKRLTLEMLHITKIPQQRRMNYKTDTEGIAHLYRHLVRASH